MSTDITKDPATSYEDKSHRESYEELPHPLRQLAQCGKVWGVAVDKKPFLPRAWKADRGLLKTYNEARAARDELIADGKNAVLYCCLNYTPYKLLDFDKDKTTGELRETQTTAIDYYRKEGFPIMESSSGVGRHILVEDKEKRLPKIASNMVENDKIPFEIKSDLMFVTDKIIESQPIKPIDDMTVDRVNEILKPKVSPRSASTTKPDKPFKLSIAKRKEALTDLRTAIQYCQNNNITNVIHNDSTFSEFAMGAKQVGLPLEEQYQFCDHQEGDKKAIRERLLSTNEPLADRRPALFKLFEDRGYVIDSKLPPDGTFEVKAELGRKGGFKYCLKEIGIEIRYNELVGIEIKLPDKDWQELNDDLFENVANDYVAARAVRKANRRWLPFEPSNETMRSVYTSLAFKGERFNPTREWLKTIEVKEDEAAIDELMNCYELDCYGRLAEAGYSEEEIKEYGRAFFTLTMSGWIRRSLTPGCLNEIIAIMVGPVGCGKGLGLKLMLPTKGVDPESGEIIPNDAFSDKCRISDEREAWYVNRRCSIGEVTELVGFSKPGNERLKATLSATHDKHEMKYKNYSIREPKAYSWTGTSNNKHFKPADGESDRRTFVNDVGYGFAGGKIATSREMPKVLNDEWRKRAAGHVLWLIKHRAYSGQIRDWSPKIEEMRLFMVGQSTKHYSQIEQALIAVAYGTTEHEKMVYKGPEIGVVPEPKPEWEHYKYKKLLKIDENGWNFILRHGLPFNPPNYPDKMPTWIRLLTLHDKHMVAKYGVDTIKLVATEHMPNWLWVEERKRNRFKRCRGWLVPDPTHGDELTT